MLLLYEGILEFRGLMVWCMVCLNTRLENCLAKYMEGAGTILWRQLQ